MVPPAGIEPALREERDFESRASTNSARGAAGKCVNLQRIKARRAAWQRLLNISLISFFALPLGFAAHWGKYLSTLN